MSDLFSGQKSLAPWIHPTVYEHLLQKIHGPPKPSAAAAANLPNKQQEQGGQQRRPKPVQVLAIGACHLAAVPVGEEIKYNAALHISDGATSIVASLSRNTDVAVRHLLQQLTRGCTVRIHDWEVVVESASTSSQQAQHHQQDELFRRFAISKNNQAVYLRVNGGIVYLGSSKDVAGNPTAILEDTDIRRALIALDEDKDHEQQQQHAPVDLPVGSIAALFGVGAPSSDDVAASAAAAAPLAVPEPAGGGLGTLDLPIGDISTLFEVSQPEVGNSAPAFGMSISPPPNNLPIGNLADLFGTNAEEDADVICEAVTDKCLADISQKKKATVPQPEGPPKKPQSDGDQQRQMDSLASAVAVAKSPPPNPAGVQSESHQENVLETSSDDDDDEKEENLGIGNMLIDPTQGVVEEAPESVDTLRDPSTTATFVRESGRNQGAVDETAGDGAYDDEWLETQQVGLPMDNNDVEVLETQPSVPEKSDNDDQKDADDDEGLETQPLDSSPRRKDSEILEAWKQHPESSSRERKAQSMKPLVPTATRWFRTLDEEAKKSPSPKKRMKGSRFGGDGIRAFVEG